MDSGVVVSGDSSPEPQLKLDEVSLPSETTSCQSVAIGANDGTANKIARCNSTDRKLTTRPDPVTNMLYAARLADLLCYGLLDTKEIYEMYCERNPLVGEEKTTERATRDNAQISNSDPLAEAAAQADVKPSTENRSEVDVAIALLESFEKQRGSSKDASGDTANDKTQGSPTVYTSSLESCPTMLFGLKKRRKKGHSRSFNETNKVRQRAGVSDNEITRSRSNARHRCDAMVNRHDDRLDDERLAASSRAIAEVPDVAVVGGGSFMPKDLCSTRILTSRVLTAPSRATYTTAYI